MRKHAFVKVDCNCLRRATNFKCKHCGVMEYRSEREIRNLPLSLARCEDAGAPAPSPEEKLRGMFGGGFDCLATGEEGEDSQE
ncbi:hypothetical protein [Nitratidesulfovibrio vulgaris]|jgi:hypothetical protein|nr:hypothetical protein [Nitratidesulfovibrio vulgaris]ADP86027.1 hypothetical protein Deval_0863 [Nitratidesulfovibrio vulgaris RCH1]GEB81203.1 hypothetical protein DDE01_26180 [Desulfovibrio desulfuricans]